MDKLSTIRRKSARGAILALLYGNPSAAVMQRSLEYALMQDDPQISTEIGTHIYYLVDKGYVRVFMGEEEISCSMQNPPREALIRLTAKGIDLLEDTIDDDGVAFGDPDRL